jgi:hypothetical protein
MDPSGQLLDREVSWDALGRCELIAVRAIGRDGKRERLVPEILLTATDDAKDPERFARDARTLLYVPLRVIDYRFHGIPLS